MIKKLHLKTMLLLCAMIMGIGNAWAAEVTFAYEDYNKQGTSSTGSEYTMVKNDVSITNNKFYGNNSYAHFYANGTTTITPGTGVTITKIVLTASSTGYNGFQSSGTITASTGSVSGSTSSTTVTWTGSATEAFTISNNKQIRWTSIVVTYTTSGGNTQTVATPTFSPVTGTYTETQYVTIGTETGDATIYYTTDGTYPTTSSNVYSSAITVSETTTIKAMAVKEGMNNSDVATATYTINLPYSGDGYVRINSLSDLTDGAKVIIAARYNSTANAYYAMTATTSEKPTGVAFTSTTTAKGEELPTTILNNESTYYWTVGVTSDGYTFTNASGKTLGYSSSTNFAEGGNNTEWTITRETSSASAMVSGYEGFYITNKNNGERGVALNSSYSYGAYSVTTINNFSNCNFYLDIFVEGATPAPAVDYTLTVTASDNVEIFTFVGDTANEGVEGATTLQVTNGTEVGLSASAAEGYELKLLVDGTDVTSQMDDTGYYSFIMPTHNVTVSATAVVPEVTIGSFVKVTSTDDITSGQYLIVYEEGSVAFDGSLETLDAVNNTIEVVLDNGTIAATTTNARSVFNIDVTAGTLQSASGYYIGVTSNSNGLKTSNDATTYKHTFSIDNEEADIAAVFDESTMTLRYNSASNQARFRYYKSGQQAIQLYKFVAAEEGATVTVTSAGYATYCSEKDLDFSNTGLTAYKATITGTEVGFTEVKQVPAGQGVLLKGDADTYSVPVAASAAALTNNAFIGVTEQTTVNETGIFVLMNGDDGVGFYKTTATSFTVGAHTAYIPALPSGARNFIAIDEATAIKAIESKQQNGEIYNLAGQRVKSAQKGLYIIDGKKVVIK